MASNLIKTAEAFLRNSKSKVARSELRREVKQARAGLSDSGGDRCYGCGKPTKYNGWRNYETWCVALWIDNAQGLYMRRQEMAEEAREQAEANDMCGVFVSQLTAEERARNIFRDSLKAWVEEMVEEQTGDLSGSMVGDLVGAAVEEVDFYEIAGAWLEEE